MDFDERLRRLSTGRRHDLLDRDAISQHVGGAYTERMKPLHEAIELLEHVRAHSEMYLDPVTPEAVENFVTGFVVACLVAEIPFSWGTWQSVVEQRGWNVPAKRPASVMREQGLGEDAIVDELFGILIATFSLAQPTK